MKINHKVSKVKFVASLAAALLVAAASSTASAAVMTFSGLTENEVSLPRYTEAGLTAVSTNGGVFWGYPTGQQLHLDPDSFGNSDYDFTFGGLAFNLLSVDVSDNSPGAIGTWTAYNASNVLVATYAMSGSTLHTDTGFAGFEGVYRVHLTNTVDHFSIDNLMFEAADDTDVPEPVSLALIGLGLAGVAATRRKRSTV